MASDQATSAQRCLTEAQMLAYLDGQLPPAEEALVMRHIDTCAMCERLVAELSDDDETRQIAKRSACTVDITSPAALDELRRRLHKLARFDFGSWEAASSPPLDQTAPLATESPGRMTPRPDRTAIGVGPPSDRELPVPPQLGRFRLIRRIGHGAFGIVYLAEDGTLHRHVALKVARASAVADPRQHERFFREAEALARLHHPHITPVFEAAEVDGVCFLVMAYCDGPTLDQWLETQAQPIDPKLAARLMVPLAEATQHAHEQGILHRDIKPSNILLERSPAGDDLPFQPRLSDFGLAKVAQERSDSSASAVMMGTPQYMAPEQLAGQPDSPGPAADVYGLGAVLYQLLTRRPPIEGTSMADTLRRLVLDDPVDVRRLAPQVPADLAAIAMKCLEKNPGERYATAAELAQDLRRFLSGEATKARPLSVLQRARRAARRYPVPAAIAALAVLAASLAAMLLMNESQLSRWRREQAEREAAAAEAGREAAALINIERAAERAAAGDHTAAVYELKKALPADGQRDIRNLAWHYLWALSTHEPVAEVEFPGAIYQVRLSPDGRYLAAVGDGNWLQIYSVDGRNLTFVEQHETRQNETNGVAWSADGKWLATVGDDSTLCLYRRDSKAAQLAEHKRWKVNAKNEKAFGVMFLDDSRQLVTCGEEPEIRLWNLEGQPQGELKGHANHVEAMVLSPDGSLLVSISQDDTAIVWNWRTREVVYRLEGHTNRLLGVDYSPDGRFIATGGHDMTVRLWDAATGELLDKCELIEMVQSVAFTARGARLVVGDKRGNVRDFAIVPINQQGGYRLEIQSLDDAWHGHEGHVWTMLAAEQPGWFFSGGGGGWLKLWAPHEPHRRLERVIVQAEDDPVRDIAFGDNGTRLYVLRGQSGVTIFDAATWEPARSLPSSEGNWKAMCLMEDRREVALAQEGGKVVVWDLATGAATPIEYASEPFSVSRLVYSHAARRLVLVPFGGAPVWVFSPESRTVVKSLPAGNHRTAAFSPDGQTLAIDSEANILIYDSAALGEPRRTAAHTSTIYALAYSSDGTQLVSGGGDRSVKVWKDSAEPREESHQAPVVDASFTPDNKLLVTADELGGIQVTSLPHPQKAFKLPTSINSLKRLIAAPDNRHLVGIDGEGNLIVIGGGR